MAEHDYDRPCEVCDQQLDDPLQRWTQFVGKSFEGHEDCAKAKASKYVVVRRDWLLEVAGDMEGWGAYASDYFTEKWDLAGDVAKVRAMAEAP